jgi:hypothetical protein
METAADVVFDYEGALAAARRLWAFADQLEMLMSTRETEQESAQVGFLGPLATEFVTRIDTERTDVNSAVTQLRTAATEWAAAWKDAIDEQNRILYARAYQYSEDHQGWFGGLDGVERPPDPEPVTVPQEPNFHPTGGLQDFMSAVS